MIHPPRSRCLRSVSPGFFKFLGSLAAAAILFAAAAPVEATSSTIVISQVYGGGGNAGATYTNDFIELYNLGPSTVDVSTWSVQYAAAAGTSWQKTNLTGSIAPGHYYLVQEAAGSGRDDPAADPGRDRHYRDERDRGQGRSCQQPDAHHRRTSCPSTAIVDFVGYGSTANCFEGAGRRAPADQHDRGPAKQQRLHRDRQQQRGLLLGRAQSAQQRVAHAFLRRAHAPDRRRRGRSFRRGRRDRRPS